MLFLETSYSVGAAWFIGFKLTSVNKSKVVNTENINVFSKNGFDKILSISRCGYREESNRYNTLIEIVAYS